MPAEPAAWRRWSRPVDSSHNVDRTNAAHRLAASRWRAPVGVSPATQCAGDVENTGGPRAGGDHQPVPGGEHLVVAQRPWPRLPRREQPLAPARQRRADRRGCQPRLARHVGDGAGRVEQVVRAELALRIERRVASGWTPKRRSHTGASGPSTRTISSRDQM